MKKIFSINLLFLSFFVLISCSEMFTPDHVKLSLNIDFAVARQSTEADEGNFKLEVTDGKESQIEYLKNLNELKSLVFTFADITVGESVTFYAELSVKNEEGQWITKYKAAADVTINPDNNKIDLKLKSVEMSKDLVITVPETVEVKAGECLKLSLENDIENVVWKTSDPDVAVVNNGVITGISAGNVSITASCSGYEDSSINITVNDFDGVIQSFTQLKAAVVAGGSYLVTSDITVSDTMYCEKSLTLSAKKSVTIKRGTGFSYTMFWIGATSNSSIYATNVDFSIKGLRDEGLFIFNGNNVSSLAPAVIISSKSGVFENVKFINNITQSTYSTSANAPAAILISDVINSSSYVQKAEINNCIFESNTAKSSGITGGALSIQDCSSTIVKISDTIFSSCTNNTSKGGAIGVENASVEIEGCTFSSNSGNGGGNDISATKNASVAVKNSEFTSKSIYSDIDSVIIE